MSDRLQQNHSRSRSRCQSPTPEQLNRILANLEEKGITNSTPDELLEQFVSLAELIRRSRQQFTSYRSVSATRTKGNGTGDLSR